MVAVRNYELEGSNYKKDVMSGNLVLLYNPKSSSKNICHKNLGSLQGAFQMEGQSLWVAF